MEDPHRPDGDDIKFRQLPGLIRDFASGLYGLGLRPGDKVSLFAESSSRWIVADQGIMTNGAADAVRGSTAPHEELLYIMRHSSSVGLVVQDAAFLKKFTPALLKQGVGDLKFIVTLWGEPDEETRAALPCTTLSYSQVLQQGSGTRPSTNGNGHGSSSSSGNENGNGNGSATSSSGQSAPVWRHRPQPGDLATLVYTSGTTGNPKGVMLTHANIAYQINNLSYFLAVRPGECTLSLLPPWHIYERAVAYLLFSKGAKQVYTSIQKFRTDLTAHPPDHFVCVPLVLDTLYTKVAAKLKAETGIKGAVVAALMAASTAYVKARRIAEGCALQYALKDRPFWAYLRAVLTVALLLPLQRLAAALVYSKVRAAVGVRRTIISGGGSLATHLDDFYEAIGLPVLNGWGLSETSPVLACRRPLPYQNIRGSVGLPTPGTQLRVVDPGTGADLPDGQQGLILARGPGVMAGYYGDVASTDKAFAPGDGWFDTGDLGWRAPSGIRGSRMAGHIVLTGRSKDTLVLSSGKNVEPQPIEDAVQSSVLIKHVVLVGNDKRELGALVFPTEEVLEEMEQAQGKPYSDEELHRLLYTEVNKLNRARGDYRAYEAIGHIAVIRTPLSPEDGTLTRTMKPRRPAIFAKYGAEVARLVRKLRG